LSEGLRVKGVRHLGGGGEGYLGDWLLLLRLWLERIGVGDGGVSVRGSGIPGGDLGWF